MELPKSKSGILGRIFSALPLLAGRRGKKGQLKKDLPWAEAKVPLRDAVVAVVTTGGLHLKTQPPFDIMTGEDATVREIPVLTPREDLCITHGYYDHTDAEIDLNLVLPIQRLQELCKAGALGGLHRVAYSMMGYLCDAGLERLREETAVAIAEDMAGAGVGYALLVPAGGYCNRSVGHVARVIEAVGIPTVALSSAREITERAHPARALYLRYPFGHALGEPGNRNQQLAVLYSAFRLLFEAKESATLRDAQLRWKRDLHAPPDWDLFKELGPGMENKG